MRALVALAIALVGCSSGTQVGNDGRSADGSCVLPNSRDATFGPASPVQSAVLDDIQDCIVNAKHPEQEHQLPAYAFQLFGATSTRPNLVIATPGGTHYNAWNDGVDNAAYDVSASLGFIPIGDRITRYHVTYNRGTHNTAGISASLVEIDLATDVETVIDTFSDISNGTSPGFVTVERVVNYTLLTGRQYFLTFHVDALADMNGAFFAGGAAFNDKL